MCPQNDDAAPRSSLGQGSGDLQLELAISQLRSAMIRAIDELDRFTEAVKLARTQVEAISAALPDETNNK